MKRSDLPYLARVTLPGLEAPDRVCDPTFETFLFGGCATPSAFSRVERGVDKITGEQDALMVHFSIPYRMFEKVDYATLVEITAAEQAAKASG